MPSEAYRGGYRGESHPHLKESMVGVGGIPAVSPPKVGGEVTRLMTWLRNELPILDGLAKTADRSDDPVDALARLAGAVIRAAAHLHGEWVRIHPFVNGNGRTARMWVLWLTSRYSLTPLLSLRPRPASPYGAVSRASLASADHSGMETLLLQNYARSP